MCYYYHVVNMLDEALNYIIRTLHPCRLVRTWTVRIYRPRRITHSVNHGVSAKCLLYGVNVTAPHFLTAFEVHNILPLI